ncbi:MAG: hypothetical protein LBJ09_02330 [Clostridiales bacterium]|jgi:hypothetical protein|nr:hypothetical protein [Clostridiales bacterium]
MENVNELSIENIFYILNKYFKDINDYITSYDDNEIESVDCIIHANAIENIATFAKKTITNYHSIFFVEQKKTFLHSLNNFLTILCSKIQEIFSLNNKIIINFENNTFEKQILFDKSRFEVIFYTLMSLAFKKISGNKKNITITVYEENGTNVIQIKCKKYISEDFKSTNNFHTKNENILSTKNLKKIENTENNIDKLEPGNENIIMLVSNYLLSMMNGSLEIKNKTKEYVYKIHL